MNLADLIEQNFLTCSFKKATGIDCLGCGMQRSFVCLLRGDLYGSVLQYPPLLFFIGYIFATFLYVTNIWKTISATFLKLTLSLFVIILLSYIYKGIFFGLAH